MTATSERGATLDRGIDTVDAAVATPDVDQPYAALGLKDDEYARIREHLGRRPTSAELAVYSVMWSEHCSYKSSRVHLRRFGEATTDAMRARLLAGIGEQAGVVDIGDGWAATFKVESHNHPSYVEPYQGAATGVGGIVRDILAMGARPVAVMDSLRFGAVDHPDTARVVHGVIAGIGGYANCLGLPNVGGEVGFDPCYQGNPLVNALCVGVLRHDDLQTNRATGVGNAVVLLGARTGGDGIGGVSILASETFGAGGSPAKRPSVQVGDPFAEKLLIECCRELFAAGLVVAVQDLGGAGLSCATSELAAAGGTGMHLHLDRVPLRDPTLAPEEILMSESQERMMLVVRPGDLDRVLATAARWEVEAAVLGELTAGDRLVIDHRGRRILDVPPATVAEGPIYRRPYDRPAHLDTVQADDPVRLPRPEDPGELRDLWLRLVASPSLCSRAWVTDQYDRYVLGNTAGARPDRAGVVRVDEGTGRGIAVALRGPARLAALDPCRGAQLALAEAYRAVGCTGAEPVAMTDGLNAGSPEEPGAMWMFAELVRGLADASASLGVPVTGGNVSLYNATGDRAIHPTAMVGVLGVLEDVGLAVPSGWSRAGRALYLLGSTLADLAGSAWAWEEHAHLGGLPAAPDLDAERALAGALRACLRDGLVDAVRDLAEGGLLAALTEGCLRLGVGARVWLAEVCATAGDATPALDLLTVLVSESPGRVLVAVPRSEEVRFTDVMTARRIPHTRVGVTDDSGGESGEPALDVAGVGVMSLAELRAAHEGTLQRRYG
ncbi:MAG: phosphoribosylformylglycinamidine synthase subunit PurL [Kineosporiaceae bacterium]